MMRKITLIAATAALFVVAILGVAQGAVKHSAKHPKVVHGLHAPALLSPGDGAHVQELPAFTWSAVSSAAVYQYEIAADPHFRSLLVVNSSGPKSGPLTSNLAGSLEKPITDGTYYWRVRAISTAKRPGPWSTARSIVKSWTQAPQIISPADGTQVSWPSQPLVLHWSEVPYAFEYIVTIATDEHLANVVLSTPSSPLKTQGSTFVVGSGLQAGQTYYWDVTPVDAEGHRGLPSRVGNFTWSWPTTTATWIAPLNALPGETELSWTPEFSWNPVAGAARYEVQVSSAAGFPTGSTWCCSGSTIGTSASPAVPLDNNEYFWRVRAVDPNGHTGVWNEGPSFIKSFDPTINNLRMIDSSQNATPQDPTVETPVITWSPVPGAASYEVQISRYDAESGTCGSPAVFTTPSPYWTPIAPGAYKPQESWPSPETSRSLTRGQTYCVQVAARADTDASGRPIESGLTSLNGTNQPAFTYETRIERCEHAKKFEEEAKVHPTEAVKDEEAGSAHLTAVRNAVEGRMQSDYPGS